MTPIAQEEALRQWRLGLMAARTRDQVQHTLTKVGPQVFGASAVLFWPVDLLPGHLCSPQGSLFTQGASLDGATSQALTAALCPDLSHPVVWLPLHHNRLLGVLALQGQDLSFPETASRTHLEEAAVALERVEDGAEKSPVLEDLQRLQQGLQTSDHQDLIQRVLDLGCTRFGASRVVLYERGKGDLLEVQAHRGSSGPFDVPLDLSTNKPLMAALHMGKPVCLTAEEEGLQVHLQGTGGKNQIVGICLPLCSSDQLQGVLLLGFAEPPTFSPTEQLFQSLVSQQVAQALERCRLQEATRHLQQQNDETLARLQAILDHLPVGLALRDPELRFQMLNRQQAIYNRLPVEAHLGRTLRDLYPGAARKIEPLLQKVLDTGSPITGIDFTGVETEGPPTHWLLGYFPVKTPDGRILGVGSIVQDITDRRNAELKLQESQHFLQQIADTTPTLLYVFDLQLQRMVFINRHLVDVLGYSPEEFLDMPPQRLLGLMHPAEMENTHEHFRKIRGLSPEQSLEREFRVRHRSGNWRWLHARETVFQWDKKGALRAILGAVLDITERKHMEEALRESEIRFQRVANQAPVMIWMTGVDQTTTFVNQQYLKFTGRSLEQEMGMGWTDHIHPEDWEACYVNYLKAFDQQQPFEAEYRMRRHDGVYRWVVDRGTPRYTPQGRFVGFIGACIDIHDRKVAEEQVQQSEQKLRELSEAQKRFVADAAHELRTPLTSIQGNLDLFTRFPNIPEDEKKEILRDVQREATRLGRLVNDMLQLARGDAGAPLREDLLDLKQVVLGAWREVERVALQHTLTLHPVEHIELLGDPDRLKQLALILLENALKYTPAGGEVSLQLLQVGGQAELRVSDTGVGIGEEDLPRVFERFFRADRSRHRGEDPGGTGLGLPIARWIVEQHGGHIRLESELGVGTTAIVTLPIRTE